ncbi:MAG TPA: hypothetical protein VKA21_04175 [Candidatus Binatia bacterium]|nr:hypothetical protein [Candidatus Binatia bacterium]
MNEAPRTDRARPADPSRSPALREWTKEMADRALDRVRASPTPGRRGNREKERFALRAQHVKTLFRNLETLIAAVNKEAGSPLIVVEKAFNPKNLGGIEVPDGARLVLKFLERRLEVVLSPLVNLGGRPVPVGALATASVIQYDPADPAGADWYDLALREDGTWLRKTAEGEPPGAPVGEKELRGLLEWLVG